MPRAAVAFALALGVSSGVASAPVSFEDSALLQAYAASGQVTTTSGDNDVSAADGASKQAASERSIAGAKIKVKSVNYTGAAQTPTCKVVLDGKTLKKDKDYTLVYKRNVNAGKAIVIARGMGAYTGSVKTTFKIKARPITKTSVVGLLDSYKETGEPIEPIVDVFYKDEKLVKGQDYELIYTANKYPGKAVMTIMGMGNYGGSGRLYFKIADAKKKKATVVKTSLDLADIRCVPAHRTYTGNEITLDPKISLRGTPLLEGVDYTLKYKDNVNRGVASIVVTGKGKYTGERRLAFSITPIDLTKATVAEIPDQYYTGYAFEPVPEITMPEGVRMPENGVDYDVEYLDNVEAGIATVNVIGKGNYAGTVSTKFSIEYLGDDLARTACMLSYSRPAYHGGGYNGTSAYHSAFSSVGFHGVRRSCDRGIATAIRYAGYDYSFPKAIENVIYYVGYRAWGTSGHGNGSPQTGKWVQIGRYHSGDEWSGALMPGDIVVSGHHICMYVGTRIAQEVYESTLAGTEADVGRPDDNFVWVSAHYNRGENAPKNAALCIGGRSYAQPGLAQGPGYIYRCVNPDCK